MYRWHNYRWGFHVCCWLFLCGIVIDQVYFTIGFSSLCLLSNYGCIHVTDDVIILLLHPPSYNIVIYGFCITVGCLSDDPLSLIVCRHH